MFLQQIVNGLTIGSTYALVAIGYSLVFGVLRLINFANGAEYMLGAYFIYVLMMRFGASAPLAVPLAVITLGAVGYVVDFVGLRRLRKKNAPRMSALISTLGVGTFIENAIQIWVGTETKAFPNFLNFGKITIGKTIISGTQIFIFITCILLMLAVSFVVYKTKIGKSMLAVSQDQMCAKLMGIDVSLVITLTFVAAAMLACISGVLVGSYYQNIDTNMSFIVGMKTFAAAVLGGVGSLPGAVLGGLIVGLAESIGASYISAGYRDAIAFAILIIVLLVKPSGIFGKNNVDKM
ncbi:branched-chain amino acid ABC transporter permease [Lacrimispora sp. NSJ-141]|uniref:Branched-chain amino acid ABC transporter permease n=1 Tax=Lientehia hominis TaxID=2897778 RepID=A0AAP2W9C9_9FIRM|nr:branched-chain amino acid ABC transporter permease [Lientehia hominis]